MLFLGSFSLYLLTLAPSVPYQGDAGELITVAYTLGIAHPPGYPLYTMLAHLFTLIPWGSVAWRVNLFSAVTSAVSLAVLYLIILKLTKSKLAGLGTALILGLSQTFWLYSLVAEVFALNNFFVLLIVYLALQKKFHWMAFTLGLSLSNHHTIVLVFPALAYLLWPDRKKILDVKYLLPAILLGTAGLLPYLYFVLRAKTAIMALAWSYPDNLPALISLISRADYGSLAPALGLDPAMATLADKGGQLAKFFSYTVEDFTVPVVLLLGLGLAGSWLKNRRILFFAALAYFVSGIIFLTYANFPLDDQTAFGLVAVERFYLLPYLFLALMIGFGIKFLGRFAPIAVFFLPLILLINNFGLVDQRGNFWGLELAKNLLATAPPKSILLVQGDIPTSVGFYARYVENFRPDVELLTPNASGPFNRYRYLQTKFPDLDWGVEHTATIPGLIKTNLEKIPFAAYGPLPIFGLESSPSGLLYSYKTGAAPLSVWKQTNKDIISAYVFPSGQRYTLADYSLLWQYMRLYSALGSTCAVGGDFPCAVDYFGRSLALDPNQIKMHYALAKALEKNNDCSLAEKEYLEVKQLNSKADFIYKDLARLAGECFKDEAKTRYYQEQTAHTKNEPGVSLEKL